MVSTKSAEKIFSAALSSFSGEKGKSFVSSRMSFGVCRHWQNKTQSPPNEWGVGASQAWKHHNVFHSFISAPTPFASYHYTHKYIHHGKNLYCQLGNWCITLSTRYRSASTSLTRNFILSKKAMNAVWTLTLWSWARLLLKLSRTRELLFKSNPKLNFRSWAKYLWHHPASLI